MLTDEKLLHNELAGSQTIIVVFDRKRRRQNEDGGALGREKIRVTMSHNNAIKLSMS
jgi:hypothetical protein